jgi:hypothetical protein
VLHDDDNISKEHINVGVEIMKEKLAEALFIVRKAPNCFLEAPYWH